MIEAPLVMHVTTTDMSLELLLGPQLSALIEAGYHVAGVSAPGPYVEALRARGVEHVALRHATRAVAIGEDLRAFGELLGIFRQRRPTIVHTHNPKPGVYGRVAAKMARVPVIVNTVHGLYALPEDPLPRRVAVYSLERGAATCSDVELVQNEEDLRALRRLRVPADQLSLLGNGIDLHRFDPARFDDEDRARARRELGATDEEIVLGTVGRLVIEKGYRDLFAARRVLGAGADIHAAVIGFDEPEKPDALTPAEITQASSEGVSMLGGREDVEFLYGGMDLFVLASHREGFPRAAMEAAAMGLPVIATDIRGCRQVVEHGVTGLLVPPRNPRALAEAIRQLADDPARRAAMGDAGRLRARRLFDQQRCIDITLSAYARLLARRRIQVP